ncbi:MAG: SH3 domain-containing protein [Polyangiaceae bacterium]|nr:SH3 domain-containing protein [Polyangiaceae bacterium]
MVTKAKKPPFGAPRVEVRAPSRSEDRVHLGRLAIIVAVGFVVGVAWPRLAGIHLAPVVPDDGTPTKKAPAKAAELPPSEPLAVAVVEEVKIGEPQITACKDTDGRAQKPCDTVLFQDVVNPRLKTLSSCEAAQGALGALSLGFDFNFDKNRVERIILGKRTTLPLPTAKALVECVEREFETAALTQLKHQYARYSVFFLVEFAPPEPKKGEEDQILEATGRATVGWELALIRETPGNEAPVKARIRSGTRVVVTGRKADWYRVKYDGQGNEGWVFKAAIGL